MTTKFLSRKDSVSTPLRLPGPKGWILREIRKSNTFSGLKSYFYDNPSFPKISLEITEELEAFRFNWNDDKESKRKKIFQAYIRKKDGPQTSLYMEEFKTFSRVFTSPSFQSAIRFFENLEERKETPEQKTPNPFFGGFCEYEVEEYEEVLKWLEKIVDGRKIEWYSNYDCIVHDEEGKTFYLDSGTMNFVPFKTEKKNGKTYIHFAKPIKKHRT